MKFMQTGPKPQHDSQVETKQPSNIKEHHKLIKIRNLDNGTPYPSTIKKES